MHQHGALKEDALFFFWRFRRSLFRRSRPRRPIIERNYAVSFIPVSTGLFDQTLQHPLGFPSPAQSPGSHNCAHASRACLQTRQRTPARSVQSGFDKTRGSLPRNSQIVQLPSHRPREFLRLCPFPPALRGNRERVDVETGSKLRFAFPLAANGRVHHLQQSAVAPPGNHEVGEFAGAKHNRNRRQQVSLRKHHKIRRHHDLFGFQPKLHRDFFHRVDGSAVNVSLAGLPQSPVADWDPESLGQTLQRRRPAVHRGGLHHFRNEDPPVAQIHCGVTALRFVGLFLGPASKLPAVRSTRLAGERVSICTSTEPGSPC